MYFKDYIKMMRDRDNLTQLELANLLNISINSIKKIEGGSTKVPNSKLLNAIADYEKTNPARVISRILFGDINDNADDESKKVMKLAFSYFGYMYLEGWNVDSLFKMMYVDDIGDKQFLGELSKKRDSNYIVLVDCAKRYNLDERLVNIKEYQIQFLSHLLTIFISVEKTYKSMTILFDALDEKEVNFFNSLKSFNTDRVKTQISYVLFNSEKYEIVDTHLVTR